MPKFSDDFSDFMMQSCTIQPFVRNNGYTDVFGTAVSHSCAIEIDLRRGDSGLAVCLHDVKDLVLDGARIAGCRSICAPIAIVTDERLDGA